jgi:hypothetical protein
VSVIFDKRSDFLKQVLRDMSLDVLGLLETDLHVSFLITRILLSKPLQRTVFGNRDL